MPGESGAQAGRPACAWSAVARSVGVAAGCAAVAACASLGSAAVGAAADAPQEPIADARGAVRDARYPGARTYSGLYSCDGCIERRLTVTVFADGGYRLRELPAQGEAVNEEGRWSVDRLAPDRLVLEARQGTRVLRRSAPDELVLVDPEGRELHGLVGGVLTRSSRVDPLALSRRVLGMYRVDDAGAVLADCASGQSLIVVPGPPGSAQAALDEAWRRLSPRDEETVLVVVRAHRVEHGDGAAAQGGHRVAPAVRTVATSREAIVVDAFERATRGGLCNTASSSP